MSEIPSAVLVATLSPKKLISSKHRDERFANTLCWSDRVNEQIAHLYEPHASRRLSAFWKDSHDGGALERLSGRCLGEMAGEVSLTPLPHPVWGSTN